MPVEFTPVQIPASAADPAYEPDEPLDHSMDCTCGDRDCPAVYLKPAADPATEPDLIGRCIGGGRKNDGCGYVGGKSGDTCPICNGMVLDAVKLREAAALEVIWSDRDRTCPTPTARPATEPLADAVKYLRQIVDKDGLHFLYFGTRDKYVRSLQSVLDAAQERERLAAEVARLREKLLVDDDELCGAIAKKDAELATLRAERQTMSNLYAEAEADLVTASAERDEALAALKQIACGHETTSGGNDYIMCWKCGLEWNYGKRMQPSAVEIASTAIARHAQPAADAKPERTEFGAIIAAGCCCHVCNPDWPLMILCPTCGNKRCPKASDHVNACTGSNEPGQPGSLF